MLHHNKPYDQDQSQEKVSFPYNICNRGSKESEYKNGQQKEKQMSLKGGKKISKETEETNIHSHGVHGAGVIRFAVLFKLSIAALMVATLLREAGPHIHRIILAAV